MGVPALIYSGLESSNGVGSFTYFDGRELVIDLGFEKVIEELGGFFLGWILKK